jgi:hypothetical protein
MSNQHPSFEELEKARKEYLDLHHQYWLDNDLFTFKWWLLLFITMVPWIVWWKIADKKEITHILLFGLFVGIESVLIDIFLTNLRVWAYITRILYLLQPILLPYDLTILPIIYMLLYQKFIQWKSFLIAITLMALLLTFVLEPTLEWMKINKEYNFPSIYSLALYILIAIFSKWIVEKIVANESS